MVPRSARGAINHQLAAYAGLTAMNTALTLSHIAAHGTGTPDEIKPPACPAEIPAPPDTGGATNTEPFCGGNYESN